MRSELLQDAIGEVREDFVLDAETHTGRKKSGLVRWGMAAAGLLLAVAGARAAFFHQPANHVQKWDDAFKAEQYFRYSDMGDTGVASGGISDSAIPYAESRFFSDWRKELEEDGVLPQMDTYPMFALRANYNADGSLYSLEISWHRRDREGMGNYSDLTVTAGYDEVPVIADCIAVEVDEDGNVLAPAVTVTEREGIRIIGEGRDGRDKTLTFQTENGWYRISGSWNDSFDSVAGLLDWFWEHPVRFELFRMEEGDHYTYCSYSEMPDAFAGYLPAFGDFGYICQEAHVTLKNGIPAGFEGHYLANVTAEQVQNYEYTLGVDGGASIHWCLETEPGFYDLEECIGSLEELGEEQVLNLAPPDAVTTETRIKFMQGEYVVTIYASDPAKAWELIDSLKTGAEQEIKRNCAGRSLIEGTYNRDCFRIVGDCQKLRLSECTEVLRDLSQIL